MSSFLHKQLKAFTLLEMMVGMIISGIVIAAGFHAYRVVASQFKSYRITSERYDNLSFFEAQLRTDFQRAAELSRANENAILLTRENHPVAWQFGKKYALRNDGTATDTFFVTAIKTEMFFRDEKVTEDESQLTELKLQLDTDGHSCEIDCRKEQPAEAEIQTEFEKWCDDGN